MAPARKPKILLIFLAAVAFLPLLGSRDIVISHEARVVQTARQMAASGWPWNAAPVTVPAVRLGTVFEDEANALRLVPDPTAAPLKLNPWLVPVLNDEIRLQKPPLPYWCDAMLFRLAGHWSEALARIIPALLGALATFLVYDLARLTIGRRYALASALIWVTSYTICDEFRKVMADPFLAFFTLLAVWAWIRASITHSRRLILLFYIAVAMGLLVKGPPLFVHLVIAIAAYHVLCRRRPPRGVATHLVGLALCLLLALPWSIYILRHVPHALEIWRFESVGEMTDNIGNARPFWYYLPLLLQISLPWTPLLLVALILPFRKLRHRRSRRRFFPLAWYALTVLFFSCVYSKKIAYLLPAMPAQTMLIAQAVVYCGLLIRRRHPRFTRRKLDESFIIACTLIVIAIAGVLNFVRTPIENARSPRRAAAYLHLALQANPDATTLPRKLPPEATLYLPLGLTYNPRATTLLFLADDLHNTLTPDRKLFADRLPDLNIASVQRLPIPGDGPKPRYKLFALKLQQATDKNYAQAE